MSNILILSCGGLGEPAVMKELKDDGHFIIGVDSRDEHQGKYLSDKFFRVPSFAKKRKYLEVINRIVRSENVDYIMGGHTMELCILQDSGYNNVLASPPEALRIIMDKYKTYKKFPHLSPEFAIVENSDQLRKAATDMGFPHRTLCIKPKVSSGSRGFRILADDYDRREWIFNRKKNPFITMEELMAVDFPPLLLMEFLEGPQYHLDILANKGKIEKIVISYRLEERFGFGFILECESKKEYVETAKEIVSTLGCDYSCFIQLIDGKLIEVGGRMQGSVAIGLDLAKNAVRLASGQPLEMSNREIRMIRYWKEIFVDKDTLEEIRDI